MSAHTGARGESGLSRRFKRIKVLSVIALFGAVIVLLLLIALVPVAVRKSEDIQQEHHTRILIRKLSAALEGQMRAVENTAKDEIIPPNVIALAGDDLRRARVI